VFILLKENHYGKKSKESYYAEWKNSAKYIAYCEGDDYWIDTKKLQTQVAFLDEHPECAAYTTNANVIDKSGNRKRDFSDKKSRIIRDMNEIVIERQFHWASIMMRNMFQGKNVLKYDWDTYICCSLLINGGIWYDNSVSCIYRKAGQGVTNITPTIKWIELNERWSNILFDEFKSHNLAYTSVYLSLTRDILFGLRNINLASDDISYLIKKYLKYSSIVINLLNIRYIISTLIVRLMSKK
jgi:hypothetical protein